MGGAMFNRGLNRTILLWAGVFLCLFLSFLFVTQKQVADSIQNITVFNDREMQLNKSIFVVSDIQRGILYDLDRLEEIKKQYQREEITSDQFERRSQEVISYIEEEIIRSNNQYNTMKTIGNRYDVNRDIILLSLDLYTTDFHTFEKSFKVLKSELQKMQEAKFVLSLYSASISLAKTNLNFVLNSYQKEFDAIIQSAKTNLLEGHENIFMSVVVTLGLFCLILLGFIMKVKSSLITPLCKMTNLVRNISNHRKSRVNIAEFEGEMQDLAGALIAMRNKVERFETKVMNQRNHVEKVRDEQDKLLKDLSQFFKGHINIVNTVLHDIGESSHLDEKETTLIHMAENETETIKEVVAKVEHLYPSTKNSQTIFQKSKINYSRLISNILSDELTVSEHIDYNVHFERNKKLEELIYIDEESFKTILSQMIKITFLLSMENNFILSIGKIENEKKDYIYITMKEKISKKFKTEKVVFEERGSETHPDFLLLKREVELLEGSAFIEKLGGRHHLSLLIPTTFIPSEEQVSNVVGA